MRVNADISPRAKDVYLLMKDLADGSPLKITQAELSEKAGISPRYLIKILQELEAAKLFTKSAEVRTNIYYL